MGKRKDPNQKGSGAKKHGRNYKWWEPGALFPTTHSVTKYRARHHIEGGISRKDAKKKARERGR
jgi:hypothetical protein